MSNTIASNGQLKSGESSKSARSPTQPSPDISSSGWSTLDSSLLKALRDSGLDWDIISIRFPGQNPTSCREHYEIFYSQALPASAEAAIKVEFVENEGQMVDLSRQLCPSMPRSRWSPEDEARLIYLAQSGLRWEEIAEEFPERSAESCRNHYERKLTFGAR